MTPSALIRSIGYDQSHHDASQFDCGIPDLNDWLRRSANDARRRRTASTFVWVRHGQVVGYYALVAHALLKEDLPASIARGGPEMIPAILLAKLALDRTLHRSGRGGELLLDALARSLVASSDVAARVLIVDAENSDVADFYRRYGFIDVRNSVRRLIIKMSTVQATLAAID